MSLAYGDFLAPLGYFDPLAHPIPPVPLPSPKRILWGADPFLRSRLLAAIQHEAGNRRQSVTAVYDPLLSDRIVAISGDSIGALTLSQHQLRGNEKLIDCNALLPPDCDTILGQAEAIARQRNQLAAEIASVGKAISSHRSLLMGVSRKLCDAPSLQAKIQRIAKQIPKGDGWESALPIFTRKSGKAVHLPFPPGESVRFIELQDVYGIATLFLEDLSRTLAEKKAHRILLTCALTDEPMGILLPAQGVCYLKQIGSTLPCKKLPMRRYLSAHTTEERRAWRNLAVSVSALERHLDRLLDAYRNLAKEEDALRVSLYNESRLQNFRKRLLIDLFC